jgi:hypothetical protein
MVLIVLDFGLILWMGWNYYSERQKENGVLKEWISGVQIYKILI